MSKKLVCYYCGIPLTGGKKGDKKTEHVPPKMMFRAFPHNSITVPSCPEHNNARSGQDQAIIAGFMKALDAGNYLLSPDVVKAIQYEKTKSTFETTKHTAQLKPLFRNPTGVLSKLPKTTYLPFQMENWIRQITAGLVFDATQTFDSSINWQSSIVYSPNWLEGSKDGLSDNEVISQMERNPIWEQETWFDGWAPYPSDIYRFYVAFQKLILFKHIFYNSYTWYIVFECGETTAPNVRKKVLEAYLLKNTKL